jgi:hypothetical protein
MAAADPFQLARSRAERYLAALALHPRHEPEHLPPGVDRAAVDAQQAARLHVALTTYRALGLVGDDDAAVWREAAVVRSRRPAPRERSSPQAVAMLERRWAELEAAGDPDDQAVTRRRVWTGLFAVTLAGALSRDDARSWQSRIDEHAAGPDPIAQRRLKLARETRLDDLRRVVAGPARGSSGLTIVSADVFADAIAIHWRHPGNAADDPLDVSLGSLEDDVGTDYLFLGGGGSGTGESRTGTAVFSPAPPPDAKWIRVVATTGDEIELTLGPGEGAVR